MTIRLYDQHSTSFDFNPGASLPFADIAELAAFDDRQISDGGLAHTSTVRSLWIKRVESPAPAGDGITIVATASGDGAWYRSVASTSWQAQATWYIDPATGDDENDGETTATALATWREFCRRMPAISIPTTVTFIGSTIEELRGSFANGGSTASLTISGTPTVFASGGVTPDTSTFVDPIIATNTRGTITCTNLIRASDGAAIDFSVCVGKMVRSPSVSASGVFVAYVLANVGGVAQHGWWGRASISSTKPSNDALVEVLTLPTCSAVALTSSSFPIQVRFVKMTDAWPHIPMINCGVSFPLIGTTSNVGKWFACEFTARLGTGDGTSLLNGCLFSTTASFQIFTEGPNCLINACGATTTMLFVSPGRVGFQAVLIQGGALKVGNGDTAVGYSAGVVVDSDSLTLPVGVYGSPTHGIQVSGGAVFRAGSPWGASNAGYGLKVYSSSNALFNGTPTITGASGDLNLSAAPNLAATNVVPIRDGVPTAPAIAMTTWATWAAARPGGLERYAVNLADGSAITGG